MVQVAAQSILVSRHCAEMLLWLWWNKKRNGVQNVCDRCLLLDVHLSNLYGPLQRLGSESGQPLFLKVHVLGGLLTSGMQIMTALHAYP